MSAYFHDTVYMNFGPRMALPVASSFGWAKAFGPDTTALDRALKNYPPENTEAYANDRFGKPTPIDLLPPPEGGYSRGPIITKTINLWPVDRDEEEEEEDEQRCLVWTEVCRTTQTRRVENPDDPEQYVDVEDVTSVRMQAPDGRVHLWRFTAQS